MLPHENRLTRAGLDEVLEVGHPVDIRERERVAGEQRVLFQPSVRDVERMNDCATAVIDRLDVLLAPEIATKERLHDHRMRGWDEIRIRNVDPLIHAGG